MARGGVRIGDSPYRLASISFGSFRIPRRIGYGYGQSWQRFDVDSTGADEIVDNREKLKTNAVNVENP